MNKSPERVATSNPNRVKRTGSVSGLEPEGGSSILPTLTCDKCEYEWKARTQNPRSCPNCKRYDYKALRTKKN